MCKGTMGREIENLLRTTSQFSLINAADSSCWAEKEVFQMAMAHYPGRKYGVVERWWA